jgi:hypothetical protein
MRRSSLALATCMALLLLWLTRAGAGFTSPSPAALADSVRLTSQDRPTGLVRTDVSLAQSSVVGGARGALVTTTITPTDPPAPPTTTATPGCGTGWRTLASPSLPGVSNYLRAVTAMSSDDAWAVGYAGPSTLIERWNGAVWDVVPSPNPGLAGNYLMAVAGLASDDVWAVGYFNSGAGNQTLVLHWNGAAWSLVPSPNLGPSVLEAVVPLAADDVWAAGHNASNGIGQTVIEHWDGLSWSIVPSPSPGQGVNALHGLTALGRNDIWAVGQVDSNVGGATITLIEHWDGQHWTVASNSLPGTLLSPVALASDNIWAVGYLGNLGSYETLVIHWNGSHWDRVTSPNRGAGDNYLRSLVSFSPDNLWAVGRLDPSSGAAPEPLIAHWDGAIWSPDLDLNGGALYAAAAAPGGDLWGVGSLGTPPAAQTLVAHYTGPCPTPSATPTSPATSTATPTTTPVATALSATATPTASSTATAPPSSTPTPSLTVTVEPSPSATECALQFNDVGPTHPFAGPIRCLACEGILSGYGCGAPNEPCPGTYFRVYNPVTRGQLAKIVALSAGLADPVAPDRQTFADVPPSHPLWLPIERIASHGVISGYACGGLSEPCDAARRPYFRPQNNVTRGQLAKIVAGAAGFQEAPTSQTFADVPPGSAFYTGIEQIATRNIISGYTCGASPAGPCDGADQRPYFLPANAVTRGQTAKIAGAAFLSTCDAPRSTER